MPAEHRKDPTRPFLRWAGAKRAHLPDLLPLIPRSFDRYYEPFLGSGALFFQIAHTKATIGDTIAPLVSTYRAVRDGPAAVRNALDDWAVDKVTYYQVRALNPATRFQAAARFIYLNKVGWNGLYRVNSSGQFNVPYGSPKSSNTISLAALQRCATLLRGDVKITESDFAATLADSKRGDFVFLDPPYVNAHRTNGFADYNEKIFTWQDQLRLRAEIDRLVSRGIEFVLTNADHSSVRELYAGFSISTLHRTSTLAGSAAHRRPVSELVIRAR